MCIIGFISICYWLSTIFLNFYLLSSTSPHMDMSNWYEVYQLSSDLILSFHSYPHPHFLSFILFFLSNGPSPSIFSTSSSASPAVIYCANRTKSRLVCGHGQCWSVWWWPMERECVARALPIWCRNWQRLHIFISQLWDNPTRQNHTGRSGWVKCNIFQDKNN